MLMNISPPPGMKIDYEVTHHTCPFHKQHPGNKYAGCTCSSSYIMRYIRAEEPSEPGKVFIQCPQCGHEIEFDNKEVEAPNV